jgi:hypothetical protein
LYHVFNSPLRAFSPRQHIAYVCRHNEADVKSCCGAADHRKKGMGRVVAEWSAGVDTLIDKKLDELLEGYDRYRVWPEAKRTLPEARKKFLKK